MFENIDLSLFTEYWGRVQQLDESSLWAVGVITIFCLLLINYRKSHHLQKKIDRLQHDLLVANNGAIGMGQQLINLEKKLHASNPTGFSHPPTQAKAPSLRVVSSPIDDGEDDAYEVSRHLLNQGYDVEEVAQKSGLSYSEVSLLKAMAR